MRFGNLIVTDFCQLQNICVIKARERNRAKHSLYLYMFIKSTEYIHTNLNAKYSDSLPPPMLFIISPIPYSALFSVNITITTVKHLQPITHCKPLYNGIHCNRAEFWTYGTVIDSDKLGSDYRPLAWRGAGKFSVENLWIIIPWNHQTSMAERVEPPPRRGVDLRTIAKVSVCLCQTRLAI